MDPDRIEEHGDKVTLQFRKGSLSLEIFWSAQMVHVAEVWLQ